MIDKVKLLIDKIKIRNSVITLVSVAITLAVGVAVIIRLLIKRK